MCMKAWKVAIMFNGRKMEVYVNGFGIVSEVKMAAPNKKAAIDQVVALVAGDYDRNALVTGWYQAVVR